ncbi:MAG TPA: GDSL family lipase, partial [Candidatus Handelsmanbacteria bacterium]|nr:GDSL family lipase [Candidatus Handelsmanbacteria bacterium]
MSEWFEEDTTMLFIGDSITDCGRRGAEAPLGAGYVRAFTELATSRWPERNIRWINKGIGGNKVSDLRERWVDDVLFHKPDRLSVKIGINDLHSSLRGAEGGVDPARFEQLYDEILDMTKSELGCPVVLVSPFYISKDTSGQTFRSQVLELLPQYIEVVSKMSDKYDTLMVPLHDVF